MTASLLRLKALVDLVEFGDTELDWKRKLREGRRLQEEREARRAVVRKQPFMVKRVVGIRVKR